MTLKMAWRNLWRNPRRTLITMASITFAVTLAVLLKSLQDGVFDHLVHNVVQFYTGYLQVHQKGYKDEPVLERSFVVTALLIKEVAQTTGVKTVVPRLEAFALASTGAKTRGCMVIGTDPVKEEALTGLSQKVMKGGYFEQSEACVLVAEGLATSLGLTVGDTLILLGQGYQESLAAGKFPVKGILQFGQPAQNEGVVYMPLAAAQGFLGAEGRATTLALDVTPAQLAAVQKAIATGLGKNFEVLNWREMMPEVANHMRADAANFYVWTGILYLIIAFGLFGTILMMTVERRREQGMLVAIGMRKTRLGKLLVAETLFISICGVVSGMLVSLPLVLYLERRPIRFSGRLAEAYRQFGFEAVFPATLKFSILLTQSEIVLGIALLIGIYPLWQLHRLDPVAAMRK